MEKLELQSAHRTCKWHVALFVGVAIAIVTFDARRNLLPALDGDFFSPVDIVALIFGALSTLALGTLELAVTIELSDPPVLVTTRTLFAKLTRIRRIPLPNVVWARVVYVDEMLLAVQVGTHGHQTTNIVCVPYSEQNIPVADKLCARVAEALSLECLAYRRTA